METLWLISYIVLWGVVLLLGFLLLGALRALALLRWRLEHLELTTPRGRNGLRVGAKAPDFTLPSTAGKEAALHDWAGRKVVLVFLQARCKPCKTIVPELNQLQQQGEAQVLAVNTGDLEAVRRWVDEVGARFPVLVQEKWALSRRYEIYATPFAFLINEQGVIVSKGIVGNKKHLGFLLSGASRGTAGGAAGEHAEARPSGAAEENVPSPVSASGAGGPS
jgi:methylamine dehydrogenase accessory protein MauD